MCGRFVNHIGAMHGWSDVLQDWPAQGQLSFNIAPTQQVPVVTGDGCQIYRWGLLPSWVTQPNPGFSTFNARLATLAEKPSFRHAWAAQQRCLVPSLGYYEWRDEPQGKQPYFVCRADGAPIVFAGLYEPPRADAPGSFTIITRPAEGQLLPLHHAMPLMFEPSSAKQWLTVDCESAFALANRPYQEAYRFYPVSSQVNKVANQGEKLIAPAEPVSVKQQGFDF